MGENKIIDITDLINLLKPGSLVSINITHVLRPGDVMAFSPSKKSSIQICKKKNKFQVYCDYSINDTDGIVINFTSKNAEEVADIVSKMLKLFSGYAIVRNFTEPDHIKIMKFEPFKEV